MATLPLVPAYTTLVQASDDKWLVQMNNAATDIASDIRVMTLCFILLELLNKLLSNKHCAT